MPRLTPTNWQTQVKIFELDGFTFDRTKGDHICMEKSGVARPVIIPKYSEVGRDIIKANMRTANMSRERYFELLNQV
ncbi:MAG: addiction module toxin, HicA family [Calditrichaeota bacterium]|nr:addiction module toxin, HicA family [Calditrichota bacterium]